MMMQAIMTTIGAFIMPLIIQLVFKMKLMSYDEMITCTMASMATSLTCVFFSMFQL